MKDWESKALSIVREVADHGINGVGPLVGARTLAEDYIADHRYDSNDARVDSLIRWETSKNFGSGFVTGLGGLITLPVSIPGALGVSWMIQARLAGAVASVYGHDLHDDRVRTLALLSLIGDSAKEILKSTGIALGRKLTEQVIRRIPGRVLIEINKKVGFRLVTKAGQKGIFNLIKAVPVAGGLAGGSIDAASCYSVGKTAKFLFAA
jgi:hypothetical protein